MVAWRHLKFEFCVENIVCSSVSVCNFWKLFEKEFQEDVVMFFWFQVEMRLKKGKEKKNDTLSRENASSLQLLAWHARPPNFRNQSRRQFVFRFQKSFWVSTFRFLLNLCPKFCHLFRIKNFRFSWILDKQGVFNKNPFRNPSRKNFLPPKSNYFGKWMLLESESCARNFAINVAIKIFIRIILSYKSSGLSEHFWLSYYNLKSI